VPALQRVTKKGGGTHQNLCCGSDAAFLLKYNFFFKKITFYVENSLRTMYNYPHLKREDLSLRTQDLFDKTKKKTKTRI
jgi:hypothetical protein